MSVSGWVHSEQALRNTMAAAIKQTPPVALEYDLDVGFAIMSSRVHRGGSDGESRRTHMPLTVRGSADE
jgi:hypothetical protein